MAFSTKIKGNDHLQGNAPVYNVRIPVEKNGKPTPGIHASGCPMRPGPLQDPGEPRAESAEPGSDPETGSAESAASEPPVRSKSEAPGIVVGLVGRREVWLLALGVLCV